MSPVAVRAGGAVVLAWCLLAAWTTLSTARARPTDIMPELDRQFSMFARQLPRLGTIGFLEPLKDAGSPEAVQIHYAAQFALVPRVVVPRVGPEYLIVPVWAASGDGDPRLAGYDRIGSSLGGHRLFRRAR